MMEDILNNGVNNNTANPSTSPAPTLPQSDATSNVPVTNKPEYIVNTPPPHGLDSSWRRWKCLVCGYVYEGLFSGKMVCPKCGNDDPDKFDEAE